ncbi:hypothetical protein [Bosea vaviloviae]|uniref:Uncharacterized protein n=1 Tax=Bosea vaviloviae TaxID=1526658 RepID=A0A0N1N0A2_9HYPH|nr:hypothetical protein [Bosea vaviloviae]KPH78956.1 hypothetical protein AE618_19360 [Bosea vaviloviae]
MLRWLVGFPVVAAVLWAVFLQPTYEHRFRITLEVETPDGPRSGSSVWSVFCSEPISALRSMTGGCSAHGEAIFVSLPNGQALIGLMAYGPKGQGVDIYDTAPRALGFKGGGADGGWFSQAPKWREKRPLVGNRIPTMVTFADLSDPMTARVLNPDGSNFAVVFGEGYRFRRATLEMVPAGLWPFNLLRLFGTPFTSEIEKRIPFLASHREQLYRQSSQLGRYVPMLGHFVR